MTARAENAHGSPQLRGHMLVFVVFFHWLGNKKGRHPMSWTTASVDTVSRDSLCTVYIFS